MLLGPSPRNHFDLNYRTALEFGRTLLTIEGSPCLVGIASVGSSLVLVVVLDGGRWKEYAQDSFRDLDSGTADANQTEKNCRYQDHLRTGSHLANLEEENAVTL